MLGLIHITNPILFPFIWPMGVVTVLVAIGSVADEAPAHGCGRCLVTNDVRGRSHASNRRVERDGCGGCLVTNDVSGDARTYQTGE